MAKTIELWKVNLFSILLIYVYSLPCETQMRQIATFCGDPIAHFCIISLTEGTTWFINFVVLNILRWN